jgi:hypothetical protein
MPALTKGIDLSVLPPEEAVQLLTSRRKPQCIDDEEQARGLAKDLGYHALAPDVTASALLSSAALPSPSGISAPDWQAG